MEVINENSREYRFKDSGPKYLMRGPNIDFGIVRLKPGESFPNHMHAVIEEDFYILEGKVEFTINKTDIFTAEAGDFVHVPPEHSHFLKNIGQTPAKAVFVKAPYDPDDKINVD